REGLVGMPLAGPSLRDRLSAAAAARANGSASRDAAVGERALVDALAPRRASALLARRPGLPIGTSVSRHAALPAAAWQELLDAARVAGEETYTVPPEDTTPPCVVYSPDVAVGTAPDLPASAWTGAVSNGAGSRPLTPIGAFRRRAARGALTRMRRLQRARRPQMGFIDEPPPRGEEVARVPS